MAAPPRGSGLGPKPPGQFRPAPGPLGAARPAPRVQGPRPSVGSPEAQGVGRLDTPVEGPGERARREDAERQLLGDGRLGDPLLTPAELAAMGASVAARHLMTLLARRRGEIGREAAIAETGGLLLGLDDGRLARRLLLEMPDAGRIVDIYPLEVLAFVLERRAGYLPEIRFAPVVLNRLELGARAFLVEELITLKVPLALRMRAFALEGGLQPGYCFAPGPPGAYHLELAAAGTYHLLVRGDVRKASLVDRVVLRVEDPPESA